MGKILNIEIEGEYAIWTPLALLIMLSVVALALGLEP